MGFDAGQIREMLSEYEQDHRMGMDVGEMSGLLYSYTSGYPFLVSRICKILDEKVSEKYSPWTKEGFLEAIKILSVEKNPLFDSLVNKLTDYPALGKMMRSILFAGDNIPYNPGNHVNDIASMFGFIRNYQGNVSVANRIFETYLYDLFLSEKELNNRIFKEESLSLQIIWKLIMKKRDICSALTSAKTKIQG